MTLPKTPQRLPTVLKAPQEAASASAGSQAAPGSPPFTSRRQLPLKPQTAATPRPQEDGAAEPPPARGRAGDGVPAVPGLHQGTDARPPAGRSSGGRTLQQLETSLLRLYVVNAVKTGHREKAAEFFQMHADKLNASVAAHGGAGADSWSRWFILPYIERPESDAYFQVFFSQPWLEAFVTSFRNFLSLVFRNLPLPKLLAFQLARLEEPTLKLRLKVSQSEATRLRLYNSEATAKIKKLEEAGRQLHSILRMMVQHSFMEHFSASSANYADVMSDTRNKNRSRSRSYGALTSGVGLSAKQMKEIGDLLGISSEDNPHADPPAPVDPRDMPRVAEVYLPVDELSDDEVLGQNDEEDEVDEDTLGAPDQDDEASSNSPSPMLSPAAVETSPIAGQSCDGDLAVSGLTPIEKPLWSTGASDIPVGTVQASLIREFNMLNDWQSTKSAMTARSRFSPDGQFLAIAKLGNTHIDIWSANPVVLAPTATIKLQAKLTNMDWLGPGPNKQLLACTLEDAVTMLWDTEGEEVITCPPNEDNLQVQQLMCAREAPIAACLFTSRDEEDNALQQVLVLHGGMEEPMQDYFPMEDKQLTCLAWSNTGNVLIIGSQMGDIEFIDVIRPERIHRCNLVSCSGSMHINGGGLSAICVSPDGKSMLSVHENGGAVMEWSVGSILAAVTSPADTSDVRGSVIDVKPLLKFTYELDEPLAAEESEVETTIRFFAEGEYFVVSDSARLHIFKSRAMNRRLAFDNRLCYERDVIRQQAIHQRKLEQMVPTSHSPSRVYLDSNAPAPQPHLTSNAKRQQIERDRQLDIYHQNQRLANKMDQIMNRQENVVLAASSSSTRPRLPPRSVPKTSEPLIPKVPVTSDATSRVSTPGTTSSPRHLSSRNPVHSPAHMHMPGIRLDATQTPLLDCHLSPECAMGRGDACKKPTLVNRAVQKRRQNAIDQENQRLKERLAHLKPYYNTKKWDGEWQERAVKFSHLHQDATVGYLLPHPKTPSKKVALPPHGGCKTTRDRGLSRGNVSHVRGLPLLENKGKSNASRAGRLRELQTRRSNASARDEDDEGYPQFRELPPCLLLEATTRQGVEVMVDELQIELTRSGIAELGDRCLETVSQVPKAGNAPSLSTLLSDDELQNLLIGVVQQLRFQVAPTPPNSTSGSQLLISWILPMRGPNDDGESKTGVSNSPRERLRPRTCPSTIVCASEEQKNSIDQTDDDYQDDFNTETQTFRAEADTEEINWAVRLKIAASLNCDGRRWRTVVRKGAAMYLICSWFEEETGVHTIKTVGVGAASDAYVPLMEMAYDITEMQELLRQLEDGTQTVAALLEKNVAPLLP
ncbi:unnamed protein product [Phytophthora fragariaefolia]|uniref:Unnamed protein product n=1 Tax=Phytophthora fragariaefolia TaxID=1490495 RepID=A0A9W6Y9F8_9STRA|nr:unnamed protein product [Phytophthora fragariaefolia]